jgi:predicted nucleic acid-binding protein
MAVAYVDTSCLVAIAFGEPGGAAIGRRLDKFEDLISSNLLEAELRSVFRREKTELDAELFSILSWVVPDRPLSPEIDRVLAAGYVRGADCWHLATAVYVAEDPSAMTFLTLDDRQKAVAASLGFA